MQGLGFFGRWANLEKVDTYHERGHVYTLKSGKTFFYESTYIFNTRQREKTGTSCNNRDRGLLVLGDLGHTEKQVRGGILLPKFFPHDSNFWDDFLTDFQDSKSKG